MTAAPAAVQLLQLPLGDIEEHPANPRRTVGNVDELAASIAKVGVLEPVLVCPSGVAHGLCGICQYVHPLDDDGDLVRHTKNQGRAKIDCPGTGAAPKIRRDRWRLLAGHRRLKAARQAGLDVVPALARPDIAGDAEQLAAMLTENLQREDLSAVEEADGYAQLRLFSWKVDDIAAATGRPKSTVQQRLRLAKLPEPTRERLHTHELTLDVAEKLVEFADDPKLVASLEREAGGYNFNFRLQQARDTRRRAKQRARTERDLRTDGVPVVEQPTGMDWNRSVVAEVLDVAGPVTPPSDSDELAAARTQAIADHASCPHHAAYIPAHSPDRATYVCTNPASHEDWADRKAHRLHDPEEERRHAEHEAHRLALGTAVTVRLGFVRDVVAGRAPLQDAGIVAVLRPFVATHVDQLYQDNRYAQLLDLMGAEVPAVKSRLRGAAAALVAAQTTAAGLAKLLLAVRAIGLEHDDYGGLGHPDRSGRVKEAAPEWIGLLTALGYQPSDVDQQLATDEPETGPGDADGDS